jgi:hypothetical protein
MARLLTELELDALNRGLARWYRGRLVPIMRGAEETDEEKAAREKAEADALAAKDKVFKQEDVDRIVQERLARDRKDRPSDDEIKALREKATKFDELDSANKTELEKERARADKAEADAKAAQERASKTLIEAAILTAASEAKAVKPEHLSKLIDMNGVTVGDDGQVTGVKEAIKTFLDANPEYVGNDNGGTNGNGKTGAADQGARGGGEQQLTSTEGMTPDEIAKAVAEGRLDNYLKSPSK